MVLDRRGVPVALAPLAGGPSTPELAAAVSTCCSRPGPMAPDRYPDFSARFRDWAHAEGLPVGEPRHSDDDWAAKLELLRAQPPGVVSFTFGCPPVVTGRRSPSRGHRPAGRPAG